MLDQLRQVAIFAKTIDHGSFRGAARELELSPSVVSHHISQLEEHLGVALLYRSTRKLALTREGEELLASTQPMLEAMQGVFSELSSLAEEPTGQLRITIPSVLIQSPLSDLIAAFSIKYPGINLHLEFTDERKDLISSGFDIAIRASLEKKKSAVTQHLLSIDRYPFASPGYIKDRSKITHPTELLEWDWIELTPVRHIKPVFRKNKNKDVTIKPTAHVGANDAFAIYRLARSGAGVAIVPESLAAEDLATGIIQKVLPSWQLSPMHVHATWPSSAPKHGLIKLFISEISGDTNNLRLSKKR